MPTSLRHRSGRLLDTLLTGCATALREGAGGCWGFLGSSQFLNVCAGMAVICIIYLAEQAAQIERSLEHVAYAQQITGYAVMRQLQSQGQVPEPLGHAAHQPERPKPPTATDPDQLLQSALERPSTPASPAARAAPAR